MVMGRSPGAASFVWSRPAEAEPDAPVLVCEGCKSADDAGIRFSDHVAISSLKGANGRGRERLVTAHRSQLIIWPDDDVARTFKYAKNVAELVAEAGAISIKIVDVPGLLPEGMGPRR